MGGRHLVRRPRDIATRVLALTLAFAVTVAPLWPASASRGLAGDQDTDEIQHGEEADDKDTPPELRLRLARLRTVTTIGWIGLGLGLGLLGGEVAVRSEMQPLTAMGVTGGAIFISALTLSTIVSTFEVQRLPPPLKPRAGRVVADALAAGGGGVLAIFGLVQVFRLMMVIATLGLYAEPMDEQAASSGALVGLGLLTASSIVGHVDNEVAITGIRERLDEHEAGAQRGSPIVLVAPLALPRGGGLALAGCW